MKCSNCGTELGENDMFCPKCGAKNQNKGGNNLQNQNIPNYNNTQQNRNSGGNLSPVKIAVIVVIVSAILIITVFFGVLIFATGSSKVLNNSSVTSTPSTSQTSNSDYNYTSSSNTQRNSSTYKVNYGGFKLYIPDNLIYQMDATNNGINIGDSLSTWVAQLQIEPASFQKLKQNKSMLSSYYSEKIPSYKFSNAEVENIDGIEFVTMEVEAAGTNVLFAFAELNSMNVACLGVQNENNDYDRNLLKNLTSIIKTAEFEGSAKNLEINGNIKFNDIDKILEKAAE